MANIYETRTMLEALNLMKPTRTFLKDTFFGEKSTKLTEKVEVDVKKGKRKMAPFVAPRVGGIVMQREGFNTKLISTPKIAPERILTIDNITQRSMGENIYSAKTPEERAREVLANDVIELDGYITRREEWMARELLLHGKIDINEETDNEIIEKEIDFNFTNKITLSGEDVWSSDKSDPIAKLKEWKKSIVKKTGQAPDILILADDVVDVFLNHPKVKSQFNLLNMKFGVIEPSIKIDGTTFYGKLPELGVEIYSYDEWFLNDKDEEVAMIPDGNVILASRNLGKTIYGAVTQMEKGEFITYEGVRVPKIYSDEKNETKNFKITSRPVPVPDDVDSWYVGKVL
ncbi:major capsid protein [Hathewaya massiliensis]|uniref:major capsid protein n=1 Tax=Hathewaya massiliensis TaxID=1964382 RepID=UPI00115A6704|nr:major capsid protein [Hathewaya massiliensis]